MELNVNRALSVVIANQIPQQTQAELAALRSQVAALRTNVGRWLRAQGLLLCGACSNVGKHERRCGRCAAAGCNHCLLTACCACEYLCEPCLTSDSQPCWACPKHSAAFVRCSRCSSVVCAAHKYACFECAEGVCWGCSAPSSSGYPVCQLCWDQH